MEINHAINFALFSNQDEFAIIDHHEEYIARFSVKKVGIIDFKKTSYDLNPKIDFHHKTIKIPIVTEYGEY